MYTISIIVETVYTVPQTVYSIQRVNETVECTAVLRCGASLMPVSFSN